MRIRKRQVPFSISSLTPLPLSDPHLSNRSPVVVQLNDDATAATPKSSCTPLVQHGSVAASSRVDRPQPSDQPLPPIGKPSDGSDYSSDDEGGAHRRQQNKQECLDEDDGRGQEGGGQKGNSDTNTWKAGILGSEIPASCPSNRADGRWCEGDKAIPLKKRRGSFENVTTENNAPPNNNKKTKTKTMMKMKAKMNKKCSEQQDGNIIIDLQDDQDGEEQVETKPDVKVVSNKKRGRGSGALMEGSRCSRVNGRGWRCCQQTLVGYSLCEHHLGKGRLRSMASVRSRFIIAATASPKNNPLSGASSSSSSSPEKQRKCGDDNGEDYTDKKKKKSLGITKKRVKLGMVKARSISSLLGQTNTEIAVADNK